MNKCPTRSPLAAVSVALAICLILHVEAGCGNDDYAKPIKQFQDASAVVIASARQSLQQMNQVEEDAELDRQIFEGEAFDEKKIIARDVVTQPEIDVRLKALDELARYTSALADLAALKGPSEVTQQFQDVNSAFSTLAKDAEKLSGTKSSIFDNAKFSGVVNAATLAVGTVVRAIEEHRARREIEKQIRERDADVTALIQLLGDELDLAYQRRKAAEGQEEIFLTAALKIELAKPAKGDPTLRILLGERLKDWRNRQAILADANPQSCVEAMRKAHEALVAYVNSDKSPKSLSQLYAAAQDFFSRVQPLAQAMAALLKSA